MKPTEALKNWTVLNAALLKGDEAFAKQVLAAALRAKASLRILYRIHSRINRLRAKRERGELAKSARTAARRH